MDLSGLVADVPPEEWESPVRMNQRTERPSLAKTLLDWIGAWLNLTNSMSRFPQKTTRGFKPGYQISRVTRLRSPRSGRFFCRGFGGANPHQ
jgi:hypothetical protein